MPAITDKSTRQKLAEGEVDKFRRDLGPFVVAAEATRMAMVFTDAKVSENPIVFANDSFLSLTGYDRDEVLGQCFTDLMERGADPSVLAELASAFSGRTDRDADRDDTDRDDTDRDLEICYRRKDGSDFWAAVLVSPVRDEGGAVVQHFISFVDLTKHKQKQAQSTMLIDELNHRVKNTLSTVQSIVSQALRMPSDAEAIRESIESRIFALSRSHDLLTHENWEGAGLRDLLETALEPFGVANGRAERFVIEGDNLRISPKATLALSIAFHELATNAVKYGALSNEAGSIWVTWTTERRQERDRLVLVWRERNGPPVKTPTRRGFGSQVIERGLAHELEGTVHLAYRADGVVCTIDIPTPGGSHGG